MPPLTDVQINGFAGVDFQNDDVTDEEWGRVVVKLQENACTRFMITLITDDWPVMLRRLSQWKQAKERLPQLQGAVAGWHIEGPFLSSKPGFHGAHDPNRMEDPSRKKIDAIKAITGKDRVLITLAPERKQSLQSIRRAVEHGFRVSLGHTDCDALTLKNAVEAGASGFTHLGNGCPLHLNRADNILWRVLDQSNLTISVIPDTIHVSPPLFRILHRLVPLDRLIYTTDAMAAAGAGSGRYTLGQLEFEVGKDRVVRSPGSDNLAGSALTPLEGVLRIAEMLGCPWQEAWTRFAQQPSAWIGQKPWLQPNSPAEFCLIHEDFSQKQLKVETFSGPCRFSKILRWKGLHT